jgi:glycosyltransferase involved in cell wall biosynthesis
MKVVDKAPKRIAFIITGLNTGGAEMMLYKLLSRMNRERFESVVISLMDRGTLGDRIEALGIPVHNIDMKPGKPIPTSVWRLVRTVRQLQPDLIQGWMTHGNLAGQLASTFIQKKIPVLWNVRHSSLSKIDERAGTLLIIKLLSYLSYLPIKIIYNSKAGAEEHKKIGYSSDKTQIIPNGFDTGLFAPSVESRINLRLELEIGRFNPMKDHSNFLKAAKKLIQKKTNVNFVMAGKAVDENNQILQNLILELNLSKQVHLLGERTDIPSLTAALDIATNSSFYGEGFPNVIGEAMSCGVPCVVTDVGDSAWIVGNTGQVVPPQNPEALCAGWLKLIDMGVEARHTLGAKARQRIEELFSLDQIVQNYEKLYQEVIYGKQY